MYAAAILAALPALALAAPAPITVTPTGTEEHRSHITQPATLGPNDSNPTVAAFLSSLVTAAGFDNVAASYLASEFAKPALSGPGNSVGTNTGFLVPLSKAQAAGATGGPALLSLYESEVYSILPSGTARDALASVVNEGLALQAAQPVTVTITAAPACGPVDPGNKSNATVAAFLSSLVTHAGFNEAAASYLASEFAKPALSAPGNSVGTNTGFLVPLSEAQATGATGGPALLSLYESAIFSVLPTGTARDALVSVVEEGQALNRVSATPTGPASSLATVTGVAATASQPIAGRAAASSSGNFAPRATGLGFAAAAVAGVAGLALGL